MVKRGELYWADFRKAPGSPTRKKRPALIVQNDAGNKFSPNIIAAAVHHDTGKTLPIHVKIPAGTAGLTKDSYIDCGMLSTFRKTLLGNRIGRLGDADMRHVNRALRISLALSGI